MDGRRRLIGGVCVVLGSMVVLFSVPAGDFVAATFASTSCMMLAGYFLGLRWRSRPSARPVLFGLATAVVLYLVFAAGDEGIKVLHPVWVGATSAASIYALIVSPANSIYVQIAVLLFDAAGYESFFRGVLQARLKPRLGAGSAPAVAALDAAIHVATLNPLWVATTFVADLAWGLTFHYSERLSASFTSHFVWDLAVFLVFPLR